jgi:CBS domain-containing protein
MRISDVLRGKGSDVVTIPGSAPVSELVALLKQKGIGAVVVVDDGAPGRIAGIVSERDVVRRLADGADGLLEGAVSGLMTSDVHTCTADDDLHDVAIKMTDQRIRHLPVVDADGRLESIVSIGDVVKTRLGQLQAERDALEGYISS